MPVEAKKAYCVVQDKKTGEDKFFYIGLRVLSGSLTVLYSKWGTISVTRERLGEDQTVRTAKEQAMPVAKAKTAGLSIVEFRKRFSEAVWGPVLNALAAEGVVIPPVMKKQSGGKRVLRIGGAAALVTYN